MELTLAQIKLAQIQVTPSFLVWRVSKPFDYFYVISHFLFASLQSENTIYYFYINIIVMKEMPSWKSGNTVAMKPGKF